MDPTPTAAATPHVATSWLAPALVLALFAVRLLILPHLGLFNDEAYYWEWSRRPDLSYFDHPPMVAWVLAASTALFGWTQLAVHAPALVFTVGTSWLLFLLTLRLFPGRREFAAWTVLAFNAMPLLGLGAVFTTPDAPCAFFWVATIYCVRRGLEGEPRFWSLAGIAAGLGFLSKYNVVLLLPGLLLYLALSREHRGWLRRREPWLAVGLMLLGMLPVLLWNLEHDWASFSFHLVERHRSLPPWLTLGRFLVAQQAVSPLLWFASLAGAVRSFRLARAGSDVHLFLLCCSTSLLFFAAVALFTLVNPNWFIYAFSTLLISGMDWLSTLRTNRLRNWAIGVGVAFSLLFYVQALTLVVPLPPRVDFTTDLHGWEGVGERLRTLRAEMPDPARTFVFSRRFQFSSLAAFYAGPEVEVTRLGGRRDQYDAWRPDEALRGRDALFFHDDWRPWDPRNDYPFERCEPAGDWEYQRHGRRYRTFTFWRCFDYQPPPPG